MKLFPHALWVVDPQDSNAISAALADDGPLETVVTDYRKLFDSTDELKERIRSKGIDMVVFTRNDQVVPRIRIGRIIRELKVGYTSVSPIDGVSEKLLLDLTSDLIRGGTIARKRSSSAAKLGRDEESYSLIFDVEQMGGAKQGLPRILSKLEDLGLQATFFVTNIIADRYSNLIDAIREGGHEIGIHGLWHEYLAGSSLEDQVRSITAMKEHLGLQGTWGANLMGRMDGTTVEALTRCGCAYFVLPLHHIATPLGFLEYPPVPMKFHTRSGHIWAIPTSMETYNKPGFLLPDLAHLCYDASKRFDSGHFSLLMHPFRDGNMKHQSGTEGLLQSLARDLDSRGTTLREYADGLGPVAPQKGKRVRMIYGMPPYQSGFSAGPIESLARWRPIYDLAFSRLHWMLSKEWDVEIGLESDPTIPNILIGKHENVKETTLTKLEEAKNGEVFSLDMGRLWELRFLPTLRIRYMRATIGLCLAGLLSVLEKRRSLL